MIGSAWIVLQFENRMLDSTASLCQLISVTFLLWETLVPDSENKVQSSHLLYLWIFIILLLVSETLNSSFSLKVQMNQKWIQRFHQSKFSTDQMETIKE